MLAQANPLLVCLHCTTILKCRAQRWKATGGKTVLHQVGSSLPPRALTVKEPSGVLLHTHAPLGSGSMDCQLQNIVAKQGSIWCG